jgi:hypothetical protein
MARTVEEGTMAAPVMEGTMAVPIEQEPWYINIPVGERTIVRRGRGDGFPCSQAELEHFSAESSCRISTLLPSSGSA